MTQTRLMARSLCWIPLAALLIWVPGPLKAGEESLVLDGEDLAVTQEAVPPLEVQLAEQVVPQEPPGGWWNCYFNCEGQPGTGFLACAELFLWECCAIMDRQCNVSFSWCENDSQGFPCR